MKFYTKKRYKHKFKINLFKIILTFLIILLIILSSYLFILFKNIFITADVSDIDMNKVPYISTYYIKPIVKPNEEVIIDFYVTDYDHKEYIDDNFSEQFTITVKVEGKNDIIKKNIKAGDNSISLGKFKALGEQRFSIIATDKYGRNSHELFNFFLVQDDVTVKEYVMTEKDLIKYNIKNTDTYEKKEIITLSLENPTKELVESELEKAASKIIPNSNGYTCIIADTVGNGEAGSWWGQTIVKYGTNYNKKNVLEESTNTRIGLQQLLDDKKAEGYNKVKLLPGTYRIDHEEPIYIPTEFTLDMNNSTLKLNQFTGDSALMLELNNTFNSHVINGTIEGDYYSHDYKNSPNNSEWVMGINIGGESKYSSFENLIVKDITGYGGGNGITNSRDGDLGYTYIYPKGIGDTFKLGDIDRNTGLDIDSKNRTTSDFIEIDGYDDIEYLSISRYLGYQGNPCGTWNIIAHFYDENKDFIQSVDGYQYRRIAIPNSSKYIRVTILNEDYPTDLSIQYFRIPTHCAFKNIKFENCRAVGLAQSAMKDMLVENCEFTRSGQTLAKCAYDAEDGWDMMQDVTFKSLSFYDNPNNNFLTCAGHNFVVEDMKEGSVYIWERTNSFVLRNSNNISVNIRGGEEENRTQHGIYRIYDNNFIVGLVFNNLAKNNTSTEALSGIIYNSTIGGLADNSFYKNCTVNVNKANLGYLSKIQMIDCDFISSDNFNERYILQFNGGHLGDYYFENCNFYGKSVLANNNGFYSGAFINCNFDDVNIKPSVESNEDDLILFKDCNINYSENSLIYYSPFTYTKGTNTQIEFNNCKITNIDNNTNSLIYAYAKPNGYLNFINSTLNLPENLTILDGYHTNVEFIEKFKIDIESSKLENKYITTSDYLKEITPGVCK